MENPGSIEGIISEANLLSVDSGLTQKEDTLHTPQPPVPRYFGKKHELKQEKLQDQNSVRESVIVDIPKAKLTPEIKETPPVKKSKPETQEQLILPKPTNNRIVYVAPLIQTTPAHSQITTIKEEAPCTAQDLIMGSPQNVKDKLKNIILNGKQETIPTILFPSIIAAPAILNYSNKTTEEIIKVPTKREINARKQSTSDSNNNNNNNNHVRQSSERVKVQSPGSDRSSGGSDKAQRNRAAAQRYR